MENSWQIQKRKEMKRGYSKILYNQRNKDESIVSVIKRLFGEHISSRLIRMQNRELTVRCITYNLHRMLNLIIIKWILQSLPYIHIHIHIQLGSRNFCPYSDNKDIVIKELMFYTIESI